jgi:hypothetical protein
MSLNGETIDRLNHFRRYEDLYRPNSRVQHLIGMRTLEMVVAPAAMGKSSLIKRVSELDERYGHSTTLSTRPPYPRDEPGTFRLLEHNDENMNMLLDKILSGELVQYKIHPTEHTFYGSEVQDHPYEHNVLPTLSGGVEQLQHVGFMETSVVGLVTPPAQWQAWFNHRYPGHHPQRLKRIQEAEISYSDLLLRTDVQWIVNREGDLDGTAQKFIDATEGKKNENDEAVAFAQHILQIVHDIKQQEQSKKHG